MNREVDTLLARRLEQVQERLAAAARRAGRDPSSVTLVAVTKTRRTEEIVAALRLGLVHCGENRVEEAVRKIPQVQASLTAADRQPVWHMVGHLQRRKVRHAVTSFHWIHSVDRLAVAREISKRCVAAQTELPALLEVNVTGEAQKYGFPVAGGVANRPAVEALCRQIDQIAELPGLIIRGLMTMAPFVAEAEEARPAFRMLRELRDELGRRFPAVRWDCLSMGMTNDFEVAVEEGATMVRIGTAIFGPRTGP